MIRNISKKEMKSTPDRHGSGGAITPRVRKSSRPQRRFTRQSVMKMLAVMEKSPSTSQDPVQDFLSTGRTGRRNALPDILGEHAAVTTSDLPEAMKKLSTTDNTEPANDKPGTSSAVDTSGPSKQSDTSDSTKS